MSSARQKILEDLKGLLEQIPEFPKVYYWKDLDFQFEENAIEFRDPIEDTKSVNVPYQKCLYVVVSAVKFTDNLLEDGSQILAILEGAIVKLSVTPGNVSLKSNEKVVQTKGKTAIRVVVKIEVVYREELEDSPTSP
ncbi:hypothetical protein V0288_11255 [Pannus brasiliensis CCIBt3594]|uniref:Uncharacterized protein n=1 Tax=Pannus brasiliensis CCIBt3594 TaxID=1427578 RepID=A0AAW9QTT3_9CHRO